MEDRRGNLWVGTWGKGLSRSESNGAQSANGAEFANGAQFESIEAPPDPPLGLNTPLALAEQEDGTVWAGSMVSLFRIDPRSGKAISFSHAAQDPHGLGPGFVDAVLVDRSGTLWVGTGGSGLHRLEPDGRSFTRFVSDPADPASLSDDFVTTLLEASDGTLWIGTRSGGLNAFDRQTGRSVRFPHLGSRDEDTTSRRS
jgi:ligand-binding sensor domain-containing protein